MLFRQILQFSASKPTLQGLDRKFCYAYNQITNKLRKRLGKPGFVFAKRIADRNGRRVSFPGVSCRVCSCAPYWVQSSTYPAVGTMQATTGGMHACLQSRRPASGVSGHAGSRATAESFPKRNMGFSNSPHLWSGSSRLIAAELTAPPLYYAHIVRFCRAVF